MIALVVNGGSMRQLVAQSGWYLALSLSVVLSAAPAPAQMVGNDDSTYVDGVLVTSVDVTTCPYRMVEPITVSVTEDWGADSRGKIFQKLRDKAKKLGADAVVLVTKGGKHMTAFAWSRREYTGRAIRFVDRTCAPNQ